MRWLSQLLMSSRMLFHRPAAAASLDDELRFHIDRLTAENLAAGMSPEEARYAALRAFGNTALLRDQTRATWSWNRLERFGLDLRYALRQLRKAPGFTCAVIGILALGLGATTAMFTVVDRVLLQPLPYENPRQLVKINIAGSKGPEVNVAPFLDMRAWSERSRTLQNLGYYSTGNLQRISFLETTAGVTQVDSPQIGSTLWATLGVQPSIGRPFKSGGDWGAVSADDASSVLLSDTVWRTAYGGDEHILGKTIRLSGESYNVIGVMPRGFTFPFGGERPLVWRALTLTNADKVRVAHGTPTYHAFARLKLGTSLAAAQSELSGIQAVVAQQYIQPYQRERANAVHLERYGNSLVNTDLRKSLLALFGAAGVLWLIACINVAGLILARASTRQREIAVRGALGASRWRIVQQLLAESLVLSLIASLLGLALAALTLRLFAHALVSLYNFHATLTPNLAVVVGLLALTIVSTLLSSLWPATSAASASIEQALRHASARSSAGKAQQRLRATLVVVEIAMSLTLLTGCGLLLRTLYTLRHVPLGFRTDHILVANMTIPSYRFAGKSLTTELYQPLLERVERLPGVQGASLMTEVPLGHTFNLWFTFAADGNSAADVRHREMGAQFRAVSPGMQNVFGFRMVKGRFFDKTDTPNSPAVLVVNRAFAREYTGQDDDPGKIIGASLLSYDKNRRATVVGVLDDQRQVSVAEQPQPEIQVCLPQITPDSMFYKSAEGVAMDLAVRTSRDSASIVPELRQLMTSASPELAGTGFTTMNQIVEDSYGSQQLASRLLEIFAGAALLLSISGVYGLLSNLVAQRKKELGIRIALGADRRDLMSLILRQAGWMLLAGAAAGLVLAYFLSILLGSVLYGVKPHDPWILAVATLLLLVCGLLSALWPARRAAAVDPMQALRTE